MANLKNLKRVEKKLDAIFNWFLFTM